MKILMVLTSHDKLGDTDNKTGFWLEEFTAPYYAFEDAGAALTLASPKGGHPPIDPNSDTDDAQTDTTRRFKQDQTAQKMLANTVILGAVEIDQYDAVFYAGGHGPLWDLTNDADSIALIEGAYAQGKIVSAVCHAPAVFRDVKDSDGKPFLKGRKVTGFSNSEEDAVQLTDFVPFLVEDMVQEKGAHYSRGDDFTSYVVTDGQLITGQNPPSSEATAKAVIEALQS